MNRADMIAAIDRDADFDVVVVGGGASGLGVAVDASSRGYRTALFEAHDFAKATSSRSTKLVHGGVRYLEQMNFSLVMEALRERGLLYRNAPHVVDDLAFIVPSYKWWEGPFYGVGLKLYDALAGRLNFAKSRRLDREATIAAIPNVQREGLDGGTMYFDGQFDDARLAITLARTAADNDAVVLNGMEVVSLSRTDGHVDRVRVRDADDGAVREVRARVVVNATGIFSDTVRRMDDPDAMTMIEPAQGVHLVLDRSFAPGDNAIMVPHTDDGRVLFVIPWHERVLVGTTDTPMEEPELEPRALAEEVGFILRNAARYMAKDPTESDVLGVFAGQRPLVHRGGAESSSKSISRSHEVVVSASGLVSIMGGKWTTYRKMAEDTMEHAIEIGGLEPRSCVTEDLRLRGWMDRGDPSLPTDHVGRYYGSDAVAVDAIADADSSLAGRIHPRFAYRSAEVAWAVRHEMARTLEDVLARRTRCLLLDARSSMEAAPAVAAIMAKELGRDEDWANEQISDYRSLAAGYVIESGRD